VPYLFPEGQVEVVVGALVEILAGPQISLGGLDAGVAQQHLDLFEFAAGLAA
jgi:hypothetical protein